MKDLNHDPALAQLRSALLQRTHGVVRRRRLVRRGGMVCLAMLLYGAGFITSQWFETRAERNKAGETVAREAASLRLAQQAPVLTTEVVTEADPEELELAADVVSGAERPQLLLRAGDAYLAQQGDIERALRCYRSYLAEAVPASALDLNRREESWLLAALRQNRL